MFQFTGSTEELVPGGADMQVTPQNIYCYVRMYALYKMVKSCEKALEVRNFIHNPVQGWRWQPRGFDLVRHLFGHFLIK